MNLLTSHFLIIVYYNLDASPNLRRVQVSDNLNSFGICVGKGNSEICNAVERRGALENDDVENPKAGNKMRQTWTHTWAPGTSPKLKSLQYLSIGVNPKSDRRSHVSC
jgi:hypothetical protein